MNAPQFPYDNPKTFVTAVQQAAAPDTGAALREASVLIRHLAQSHPDWTEEACFDLLRSTHALIRMALSDALEYLEPTDPDLATRLAKRLRVDECQSVRRSFDDRYEMA